MADFQGRVLTVVMGAVTLAGGFLDTRFPLLQEAIRVSALIMKQSSKPRAPLLQEQHHLYAAIQLQRPHAL